MATARTENVVILKADNDTYAGPLDVQGIKCIAGATGGVTTIKHTNTSGEILWSSGTQAANAVTFDEVCLKVGKGVTVHMDTVDATVYLYLK